MQNEMRDRLVELLYEARNGQEVYFNDSLLKGETHSKSLNEFIADHLIENGVIVLPCKVGDYCIYDDVVWYVNGIAYFGEDSDFLLHLSMADKSPCGAEAWFKEVILLTKEEAERKLKGGARE